MNTKPGSSHVIESKGHDVKHDAYEAIQDDSTDVTIFRHQVGGRCPLLWREQTIIKPAVNRELDFYSTLEKFPALIPFVPKYYGLVEVPGVLFPKALHSEKVEGFTEWGRAESCEERMNMMLKQHDKIKCITLEDLAAKFKRPCILDLKIGTRQHGPDAPAHKIKSKTAKCLSTTSCTLGLRMCGMQVFVATEGTYLFRDKYHGRSLTASTFPAMLKEYFNNGSGCRFDLLPLFLERLKAFRQVMAKQTSHRFYSCSLLLVHEGWDPKFAHLNTTGSHAPAQCTKSSKQLTSTAIKQAIVTALAGKGQATQETGKVPINAMAVVEESKSKAKADNPTVPKSNTAQSHPAEHGTSPKVKHSDSKEDLPSFQLPAHPPCCDYPYDHKRMDLRLLDFAQTGKPEAGDTGPDTGLLFGLDHLIRMLSDLVKEGGLQQQPQQQQQKLETVSSQQQPQQPVPISIPGQRVQPQSQPQQVQAQAKSSSPQQPSHQPSAAAVQSVKLNLSSAASQRTVSATTTTRMPTPVMVDTTRAHDHL